MGAKLSHQKSSKLKNVADLKKDEVNYAPVPFNQLLDGKVAKFTVKVERMEEQLLTFLQEEAWMDLSDQQLLENGFSKVIFNSPVRSSVLSEPNADERPSSVGE